VLGIVLDEQDRPIASFLWPGNTADVTTLLPVVERLRNRFGVERACIVADRGMISAATIAALEAQKIDYILGDHVQGMGTSPAAMAGYPLVTVPAGFVQGVPVGSYWKAPKAPEPTDGVSNPASPTWGPTAIVTVATLLSAWPSLAL